MWAWSMDIDQEGTGYWDGVLRTEYKGQHPCYSEDDDDDDDDDKIYWKLQT
jgi:hypothetical protein